MIKLVALHKAKWLCMPLSCPILNCDHFLPHNILAVTAVTLTMDILKSGQLLFIGSTVLNEV